MAATEDPHRLVVVFETPAGPDARGALHAARRLDALLAAANVGGAPALGAATGAPVRALCPSVEQDTLLRRHAALVAGYDDAPREAAERGADLGARPRREPGADGRLPDDARRLPAEKLARYRGAVRRAARAQALQSSLVDASLAFVVSLPEGVDAAAIAAALRGTPGVARAYRSPRLGRAPVESLAQRAPAPFGGGLSTLNALGFCGRGVRIVNFEGGFHPHVDLPPVPVLAGLSRPDEAFHGTATLGILCGRAGEAGPIGLAVEAEVGFASPWVAGPVLAATPGAKRPCGCGCVCACACPEAAGAHSSAAGAPALEIVDTLHRLHATGHLRRGDILLIEAQLEEPLTGALLPLTADPLIASALLSFTADGVVVVAAAGNGGVDLDAWRDPETGAALPETDVLLVGAASRALETAAAHPRHAGFLGHDASNYGRGVRLFGLGHGLTTCGAGPGTASTTAYWSDFGGTSAAAAWVAAGLAVLQSAWDARYPDAGAPEARHDGPALEALLVSALTAPQAPAEAPTGVLPDFARFVRDAWALTDRASLDSVLSRPTLRASVAESEPPISTRRPSPDTLEVEVVPQVSVDTGLTGGQVHLYLAPPATLPTPDLWRPAGSAPFTVVPGTPFAPGATASKVTAIVPVPDAAPVAIAAVLETPEDPAVAPADLAAYWSFWYQRRAGTTLAVQTTFDAAFDSVTRAWAVPCLLTAAPDADVDFETKLWLEASASTLAAWQAAGARLRITSAPDIAAPPLALALTPEAAGPFADLASLPTPTAPCVLAAGVFPARTRRPLSLSLTLPAAVTPFDAGACALVVEQRDTATGFVIGRLVYRLS
jgi:hypothetical protein